MWTPRSLHRKSDSTMGAEQAQSGQVTGIEQHEDFSNTEVGKRFEAEKLLLARVRPCVTQVRNRIGGPGPNPGVM